MKASYFLLACVVVVFLVSLIAQPRIVGQPSDQIAQTGFFSIKSVAQKFQSGINFLGLGSSDYKTTVLPTKNAKSLALLKYFFNLFDNPPDPTDPPSSTPPSWCQGENKYWIPDPPPGTCIESFNDFEKPGEIRKFLEKGRIKICFLNDVGEVQCLVIRIKCKKNSNGQFEKCELTFVHPNPFEDNLKGSCTIEPPYDPENPGTEYKANCILPDPNGGNKNICFQYIDGHLFPVSCDDPPKEPALPPGTSGSRQNY